MARVFENDQGIMMSPVFKKSDFFLCEVPVPRGYPQSQTHAGVGLLSNGIYVLSTSPYPSVKYSKLVAIFRAAIRRCSGNRLFARSAESYENPCLYLGIPESGNPPTRFRLAQSIPLMGPLDPLFGLPSFNSDPDLFIEDDTIYVLNRSIYRKEGFRNYYMRLFLIEGIIVNRFFKQNSITIFREGTDIVGSQCLIRFNGHYFLMDVMSNSYNDGQTFNGIRVLSGITIQELKRSNDWRTIKINANDLLPWHMSLFQYNGSLYSIIACVKKGEPHRCWQMLGMFNDSLSELTIYDMPLTDYKSYRSAALVRDDGMFVLYNTTVHERIKRSRAVDGRNVLLAIKPFQEVLNLINPGL